MPDHLWHYTCADGAPLIVRAGILRPNPSARHLPQPVVWATDLDHSDVPALDLALGLRGGVHARCDRTAYRFAVLDVDAFEPWLAYARRHVRAGTLDREVRDSLNYTPEGMPQHWYVSTREARVALPTGIPS